VTQKFKNSAFGLIPDEWHLVKLGSVAFITKLAGFEYSKYFNSYQDGGEITVLRGTNITHNRLDLTDVRTIPKATSNKLPRSKLFRNDLVFAYVGTIGPVYLVQENDKYHLGPNTCKISANDRLSAGFLLHFFLSNFIRNEIKERTSIGAQPSLSMRKIRDFGLLLPPLPEQNAIAEALSDADALIASLEKLIEKKRAIKQGAMQELLTGKRRLPGFSGDWVTKKLGELFSVNGGVSASRDMLGNEGVCYLHYGDIHGATKTFIDVDLEFGTIPKLPINLNAVAKKFLLLDGDVVFVDASEDDGGTSRHVVIRNPKGVPFISGLHTIVAKSKDDSLDNNFKMYCFQTQKIKTQFKYYAVGTKVSGVSKTSIVKIELSYPEKNEQTAIAAILSDMDSEIQALEQKLTKYRQIKQGMMQELLTGRIRLV